MRRLNILDEAKDNLAEIAGYIADSSGSAAVAGGIRSVCLLGPGDVLVLRPLIVHRSLRAIEPSRRRVLHLEYATDRLPGGLKWAIEVLDILAEVINRRKNAGLQTFQCSRRRPR